jgi:hypothetical protein
MGVNGLTARQGRALNGQGHGPDLSLIVEMLTGDKPARAIASRGSGVYVKNGSRSDKGNAG